MYSYTFFFSSRRRHTRSLRDWSSDVCSSDLVRAQLEVAFELPAADLELGADGVLVHIDHRQKAMRGAAGDEFELARSEERRVGKECRSRWSPDHVKKKKVQSDKRSQEGV